ncbi:hypothetical protein ACH5RR_022399 [Cinchona calisaya]|uniref:DUF7870 domain-containing protein n=1 Tax=Cinchona calisaya TaxID=153742 RepID=A0ABD2ZAW3_9GENT
MNLARGHRANVGIKAKELNGCEMGLNSHTLLVIKLPDSRVLQIMSRSLFLAIILLTLPSIGSVLRTTSFNDSKMRSHDLTSFKILPVLFRDLADEGLLKRGHKGLVVGSGIDDLINDLEFLNENDNVVVIESDLECKNSLPNEAFDFVLSLSFKNTESVDRVLKDGGIVITKLRSNPSSLLQQQPNYRIVYLRRFENTMVAMRKISSKDGYENLVKRSTLCGTTQEARKMALKGLEDALLEPPTRTLLKSSRDEIRKIKFLPDLLGNSLATYKRRILISDEKNGFEDWFHNSYPTNNRYFETYNLEIDVERYGSEKLLSRSMVHPAIGISDWLRNNVRQEDFVVMKAEAQIVDEMMKEKTICLVDELFLECNNQFQDGVEEGNESKRAYWQCLALYGSLRDQGVAVHQWWN